MKKLKFIMLYCSIISILFLSISIAIDFRVCELINWTQFFALLSHSLIFGVFTFSYLDDTDRVYMNRDIKNVNELYNHRTWFSIIILFWLYLILINGIYLISFVWCTRRYIVFIFAEALNIKFIKRDIELFNEYKELEIHVMNRGENSGII